MTLGTNISILIKVTFIMNGSAFDLHRPVKPLFQIAIGPGGIHQFFLVHHVNWLRKLLFFVIYEFLGFFCLLSWNLRIGTFVKGKQETAGRQTKGN
jgi:hypothetical protein